MEGDARAPRIVVLAGPNGAGKTTLAPRLLQGALHVSEFLNADLIARGIAPFAPESVAFEAGEILLRRMDALADRRVSFGFETTLASRSLASRFRGLQALGYEINLVFVWLPSVDVAVARVATRVQTGGHNVPEADIRRRFVAGLRNFFELYQPLVDSWRVYNGTSPRQTRLIATGKESVTSRVWNKSLWNRICQEYRP